MKIKEGFYLSPCGEYKVECGTLAILEIGLCFLKFVNGRTEIVEEHHVAILLSGWKRLEE